MIEVQAKLLKAALQEAAAVVARGADIPILANVLIEGSAAELRIHATDIDLAIDRHVAVESGGPLKTTVSAKVFASIAAKLPAEALVTLELDDGVLLVRAGRARFRLATLPVDDFPVMAEGEWTSRFEMAAFDLAKTIDMLRFAVSTEEARYYLNGIFFHRIEALSEDGEMLLRAAATDGHRLARYELPLPDGAETLPDVIVPRKAIELIRKLIDKVEGPVELAVSPTRIRIVVGETVLTAKLIDGTFPDYSRVIPVGNDKHLSIGRGELAEAVERVATIASEKTRAVRIDFTTDVATLTVTSAENGVAVEELPCGYAAEALGIGFNARYLLDVLARVNGDRVVAELSDPTGPVLLRDPDCGQAVFVLMPMRA